jgi:hypothetical protein
MSPLESYQRPGLSTPARNATHFDRLRDAQGLGKL